MGGVELGRDPLRMRRLLLLAAVLLLAIPAPAAAATTAAGASSTTVDLGGVTLGDLSSGSLGSARVGATTVVQPPAAGARIVLPGGRTVELDSTDGGSVPSQQAEVPGLGTVSAGGLVAAADDVSARAAVEALQARLTPLGLRLGTQQGGLEAVVDDSGTGAVNGLSLTGLGVSLEDLLGADLLAELPLGVLLDLADELNLNLGSLGLGQLDALLDTLEAGAALAAQVETAQATLAAARAAVTAAESDLADAQQQATAAAAAVTAQQQTITDLTNQIGGLTCAVVPTLCSQLQAAQDELVTLQAQADAANQLVTTATATLDAARTAEAQAADALDALIDEVEALLATLTQLLAAIDALDLNAVLEQLRAGLAGVELLAIDELALEVSTLATADASAATAACSLDGVRIAGQALDVDICRQLAGALDAAVGDLLAVLDALPLAAGDITGVTGDIVSVTAPRLSVTEADAVRDGARIAEARIDGLGLDIVPLALTDAVDDLLGPITAFVDGPLAELLALPGVDATAVTAALDDLIATVGALPVGDLAGLSTAGLSLAPASIVAASEFSTAQVGPGTTPPPGGTGSPTQPAGDLPATGGGIAAGVLLLTAGVLATAWLRRNRA
jgi:trimeric autotransporter adhesin